VIGTCAAVARGPPLAGHRPSIGNPVLDLAFLAGVLVLFVVVGLLGKAVEKL
jgi:hypothetical protein